MDRYTEYRLERFANAPSTASSPEFLADLYGPSNTVQEFAQSLPRCATIADIGAGRSAFGAAVASYRCDIHWINLDKQYAEPEIVKPLAAAAPPNVQFEAVDALKMPASMAGTFDRVYSYNFYPHILRFDRELGRFALFGATKLLKPDGELLVGPTSKHITNKARWGVVRLLPEFSGEKFDQAIDELSTSLPARIVYHAMEASGVGIYPANRFENDAQGIVLSDDGGETSQRLKSKSGAALALRLASGFVRP